MATLGIPLLFLLGASGYAYYKHTVDNPTPVTDGGPPEADPSKDELVQGGPQKLLEVDGGPITNPSIKVPVEGRNMVAGRVRDNIRKGAHPFNNTGATFLGVAKKSPGVNLYPPGLAQFGTRDERNKASKVKTRATPEVAHKGMARIPDPMSGILNLQKHGLAGAKASLKEITPQGKYLQARHPSFVPSNWAEIDPLLGTDPQADDFWKNDKKLKPIQSRRYGGVEKPASARPVRDGSYHFTRK
jgi:hypothetical protein